MYRGYRYHNCFINFIIAYISYIAENVVILLQVNNISSKIVFVRIALIYLITISFHVKSSHIMKFEPAPPADFDTNLHTWSM